MRSNIKNNYITYVLLTGLFVCGFVLIATPVMAQDVTNAELKTSIENLNGGIEINRWLIGGMFVSIFVIIPLMFYLWGRVRKLEGVWDVVKNFVDVNVLNKQKKSYALSGFGGKNTKSGATAKSPLALNEEGRFLLEATGAKAYIDKHINKIVQDIEQINEIQLANMSAFQIKRQAEKYLEEKQDHIKDIEFQRILAVLYQHSIDYDTLALVMSLELRDRICNQYDIPINLEQKQRVSK